jgi:arylsulfatase A-like enzyme
METAPPTSTESLATNQTPEQPWQRWVLRAAAIGLLVSVPRAMLVLARHGDFTPDVNDLAATSALRSLSQGLWISIPAALLLIALSEGAARRGHRLAPLILAGILAIGSVFFVTFRLPHSALYASGLETSRGIMVHLAASLVALTAACCMRPRFAATGITVLGSFSLLCAGGIPLLVIAQAPPPASWPERPNVVLISLDTLRPDRLQSYGYERATSPNIARFFEEATRFEQVLAPDSWTLTCHVTMLTGLEPSAHGVNEDRPLAPLVPTLATHMLDAGYSTMAIVDDCPWVDARYGLGRGFELYRTVQEGAGEKVRQAIELLEATGDRPFLMFLHCYDAHSDFAELPYESAPDHMSSLVNSDPGTSQAGLPAQGQGASAYLQELNDRGERPDPAQQVWISELYDAGIATLDRELGTLFEFLEDSGRTRDTIVILTSDHGEEFFEHGRSLHTQFYAEHLLVPLLIRTPDSKAESIGTLAGLVDITPTVLDLCGIEYQLQGDAPSSGHSLAPYTSSTEHPAVDRSYIAAEAKDQLVGVRSPHGALVRHGRDWRLYDRREDPGEHTELSEDPSFKELEQELRAFLAESKLKIQERVSRREQRSESIELDPSELKHLHDLGYAGETKEEGSD